MARKESCMGEIVRVGAIGKNPAIDKINQLNEVDMKNYAVSKMEAILLNGNLPDQAYGISTSIDFSKVNWEGRGHGAR